MKKREIKTVITYILLGLFGIVMLFPVIWMFFACFKTNNEIFGSLALLPEGWSLDAFIQGWKTTGTYTYAQYFINTFLHLLLRGHDHIRKLLGLEHLLLNFLLLIPLLQLMLHFVMHFL